jgi:hypothetical protein
MLCVRIDGRDVETTPISLARMVFDGQLDRGSPSKASGGESEQSLEQSLGSSHCEALTCELLHRLRSMYSLEPAAVDMQDLRRRVEDLCQWRWANPQVTARFFWAAAWLNELADRTENAVRFYDTFLQMATCDSLLRLLAYNNRGVLRIRGGRLEGVQDLARAAIPGRGGESADSEEDDSAGRSASVAGRDAGREKTADRNPMTTGLPTACFNLLNLINVALNAENLRQAVDEELADFFAHLPDETRALWLGSSARTDRPAVAEADLPILRDPASRRLNRLTARLAARARRLTIGESRDAANWLSPVFFQPALSLWECRADGSGPRVPERRVRTANAGRGSRAAVGVTDPSAAGCAEAASLLLSDDIPSALARLESPLNRAEQFAHEELAEIEGHLALNRHELARSRLQAQRRILSSLNRNGRLAGLLARVDAQLERINQLEAQKGHLEFQRTCARLLSEVEQFCRITDLCRAETALHDMNLKLQDLKAQSVQPGGGEAIGLLDELNARVEQHLRRLQRVEIRRRIRGPLRQVRENWPTDWTAPVDESAYQAVALCLLNDPNGWVRNWSQLREQLDAHQGQYHLRTALTALPSEHASWDRVEDDLAKALGLKPDLWSTVAPLFGWSCVAARGAASPAPAAEQAALREAAGRLFATLSGHADTAGQGRDHHPARQAARLLGRVFTEIAADPQKVMRLWHCVEATLSPVLAHGDTGAIAEAAALVDKCLDHWPAGHATIPGPADPRNPVRLFLESCAKARCLAEAERLLHARPPQLEEAKGRYLELVGSGPDTRDQLRRAVTGLYLAGFCRQDSAPVQRRVLTALETWVRTTPEDTRPCLGTPDVVRELEKARAAVVPREVVPVANDTPAVESMHGEVEGTPVRDGFDDIRGGSGLDHSSSKGGIKRPEP